MIQTLKNWVQYLFSKPAHYRQVYRAIRKYQVESIVQIGIGDGTISNQLIAAAQSVNPDRKIRFTGIDLFEARPANQDQCSLIDAHKSLNETGAKVKLMPGDPLSALSRIANSISDAQLLIISADQDQACLERSWFYVPRILADDAIVMVERPIEQNKFEFDWLEITEVEQLAEKNSKPLQRNVA